jgi:hypothetical protein
MIGLWIARSNHLMSSAENEIAAGVDRGSVSTYAVTRWNSSGIAKTMRRQSILRIGPICRSGRKAYCALPSHIQTLGARGETFSSMSGA